MPFLLLPYNLWFCQLHCFENNNYIMTVYSLLKLFLSGVATTLWRGAGTGQVAFADFFPDLHYCEGNKSCSFIQSLWTPKRLMQSHITFFLEITLKVTNWARWKEIIYTEMMLREYKQRFLLKDPKFSHNETLTSNASVFPVFTCYFLPVHFIWSAIKKKIIHFPTFAKLTT